MTDNEKDVLRRSDRLRNEKPDCLPKQASSRQHIDISNKYQEDGDIIEDHGEQFSLKRVVKEDSQNKDGLGAFCKSTVQGSIQAIAVKVVTGALVLGLCGLGINLGTSSNASNTQQTPSSTVGNSNSDSGTSSNNSAKNNTTSKKKKTNTSSSNKKIEAVPNPQPVENSNSGISTPQKGQSQSTNTSSDQNSTNTSESNTTNDASSSNSQNSTANNTTDQSSQSTDSTNTSNNSTTSDASSSDTSQ